MTQSIAALFEAALALPETERAELTDLLAATLKSTPAALHPDWPAELHRRAAEIDNGKVMPIAWDEVRRQAQAQLAASDPQNG